MKQKLLMICRDFPNDDFPEKGIFFRDHANALSYKFDVTVANIQVPSFREAHKLNTVIQESKHERFSEISLSFPVFTHRFSNAVEKAYQKAANELAGRLKPDLILAQTAIPPGEVAQTLAEYHKVPYFIFEHYSFLDEDIDNNRERYFDVYSDANGLLAVSESLCDIIESQTGFSANHLANCLGIEFSGAIIPKSDVDDEFKLLWVGRNHPVKQPELLFQILEHFTSSFPWSLTVVARDFLKYKKQLAPEILENVTFIDSASRKDLIELYSSHHLTISTSKVETFGLAMLESLACGTPVICTPSGGPEQYVDSTNGRIVEAPSAHEMAINIEQMADEYEIFNGTEMSSEVLSRFGGRAFADKFSSIVSEFT